MNLLVETIKREIAEDKLSLLFRNANRLLLGTLAAPGGHDERLLGIGPEVDRHLLPL